MSSRPHLPPAAIDYPSSDGKPLAENDLQTRAILYAFGALRVRYSDRRADVYVSADLLSYGEEHAARREEAAARHAAEVRVAELEARVRALEGTPEPSDAS